MYPANLIFVCVHQFSFHSVFILRCEGVEIYTLFWLCGGIGRHSGNLFGTALAYDSCRFESCHNHIN